MRCADYDTYTNDSQATVGAQRTKMCVASDASCLLSDFDLAVTKSYILLLPTKETLMCWLGVFFPAHYFRPYVVGFK